jgi:hypothetical protein
LDKSDFGELNSEKLQEISLKWEKAFKTISDCEFAPMMKNSV